jgi:diadenosine tetraphosphate (Ap4A) HIT family hydrolase
MTASAQLSIDEFRELFVLTKNFRNLIASQFAKETVIFEHGILSAGSSRNCGVDHLHIHIVPVKETTRFDRQLANIISMNKIGSMQELREFSSKDDPYLYVSTSETRHLARVDKALPSQFMRIALCDFLGKTEWDWRKAGIEKTLVQTYELFRTLGPDIERYVSMDKVAA